MDRNPIAQRQADHLKIRVLREYFDFRDGRPTAESVSDKLGIPVDTVRRWLADDRNAEFLDEIVPLWPNIGGSRQYATSLVPEALETIAATMRGENGANPKAQMEAARFLLALAGVRPTDKTLESETEGTGDRKPAVLLNLFVSGNNDDKSIRVVDGSARLLPTDSESSSD